MKPLFKDFIRAACEFYDISEADIMGKCRTMHKSQPRHMMIYAYRQHSNRSYPYIGSLMGRDHTTIIHSVRFVESLLRGLKPQNSVVVDAGDIEEITRLAFSFAFARKPMNATASFGSNWANCDMAQLSC